MIPTVNSVDIERHCKAAWNTFTDINFEEYVEAACNKVIEIDEKIRNIDFQKHVSTAYDKVTEFAKYMTEVSVQSTAACGEVPHTIATNIGNAVGGVLVKAGKAIQS